MPRLTILISITLLFLALTARSQLILQTPEQLARMQETLNADPSLPQFDMTGPSDGSMTGGPTTGGPKLTECLTVERKLSLFYEYLREVTPVVSTLPHFPWASDSADSCADETYHVRNKEDNIARSRQSSDHRTPAQTVRPTQSRLPALCTFADRFLLD
jgi:hypothetical protein